ncbi:hypothetical protein BD31_I0874 [Candidatus Nitrosopumilus salaria BD31]|uniref:Uncharacterized protein n=2 Tax=Nitrosopumilus TaxID=338191 RepID=I3CZQ1_9ARCH|nr:hypothetical protein BD31_I0874 [Candidatus Nitrosopumilus salaria BD31]
MPFCNMIISKFLVLPLFFALIISGTATFSFGAVNTEAQEDIMAGCRSEQSLVFRFAYKDYVCLDPPTAERWEKLGLAEIIQNATKINQNERDDSDTVYYGAPPPAPQAKHIDMSDDSECRSGYTLVHRLSYDDLYCISSSTAKLWERLGLAEIIITDQIENDFNVKSSEDNDNDSLNKMETNSQDIESLEEVPDDVLSLEEVPDEELNISSNSQESNIPKPLKIFTLYDRILVAIGNDGKNSVLIEGDTGLIVIDTLSSYEESKKFLETVRLKTDKPINIIVYTTITPEQVSASRAYIEEGDGSVGIVINESLVDYYNDVYGLDVVPTHTYESELSLDISNVKMNLFLDEGEFSDQTYVYFPDENVLLIGDSVNGIHPFLLHLDYLENLLD